jgi:hypothetical protein
MKFKPLLRSLPVFLVMAAAAIISATVVSAGTVSPQITATGPVGTTVTFSGSTFTANTVHTVIFIDAANVERSAGTLTSSATGTFVSAAFSVPAAPAGQYTMFLREGAAGNAGTIGTFTITPSIVVSPASAPAGTSINVSGTGFALNSTVNIYLSTVATTTGTPVAQATTNLNTTGSFSQSFTLTQIPLTVAPYVITAADSATTPNVASANFVVQPRIISLSAEAGAVGDSITVNADGFTASGSVSIFFDNTSSTPLATVAANASGVIPATSITIPPAVRGIHNIIVRDNTYTSQVPSKIFQINQSKVILSPTSGTVGTVVTVNGNGFGSGVTVAFEFDGSPFLNTTTVTTDTTGSFTKTLTIPNSGSGVHVITARVTTDSAMFATANFTVSSKITISPTTGKTGDQITITGTGFKPNGQITLAYDSLPLPTAPATVTVLPDGTFTGIFTVPGAVEGGHTVIAADGLGNLATTGFNSTITASLTPDTSATPGFVGQDITVTGSGFKPTAAITVKLENNTVATGTSNASGSFTITFKAPIIVKGAHPVTVSDGQTTKPFTFTMEGVAPQGPTLTEPASGIKAKQPITFTWGAVTDLSNPVTYKLEVATDANFTTLILSKDGLTTTSYAMTEAEKLPTVSKKAPYYWRVIATDAAGNVGAPSTANSFVVGFSWADVPVWAWVTIGFFAVIIIGGGVYLLLRRRSGY